MTDRPAELDRPLDHSVHSRPLDTLPPVSGDRYFVIIGNSAPEGAVSKLKTTGVYYEHKKLESSPENWQRIIDLVDRAECSGVVAKLTTSSLMIACSEGHVTVAENLFAAIASKPHVVYMHQQVMTGQSEPDEDDAEWDDERYYYFDPPPDEIRLPVLALLDRHSVNVVPYETNAELSVLSGSFIEDHERNLLFRLYVPAGRIFAAEADKLLSLFKDWLTRVKKLRVRQDGYSTGSGEVYELIGEDMTSTDLVAQFSDFSEFLELCVSDPIAAVERLAKFGVESAAAQEIVTRYGKETRRLQLDLRQAREAKILSITHRLESELLDVGQLGPGQWPQVESAVEALIPAAGNLLSPSGGVLGPGSASPIIVNQTVNQQIIEQVQGTVIQSIQGTVSLGPEARELLALIQQYGDDGKTHLESALHEVEDRDARASDRLGAKQKLKAFLWKLEGKVEDSAIKALQTYVESKF
jgi:hypothetical protein